MKRTVLAEGKFSASEAHDVWSVWLNGQETNSFVADVDGKKGRLVFEEDEE